jgi:hypothetical protein
VLDTGNRVRIWPIAVTILSLAQIRVPLFSGGVMSSEKVCTVHGAAIRSSVMIIAIAAGKISGETLVKPEKRLNPRVGVEEGGHDDASARQIDAALKYGLSWPA